MNENTTSPERQFEPGWLETVRGQVKSLRYGVVQIVVHNSEVIQIEKTERLRLGKSRPCDSQRPDHWS